jgi:hypothetical protein
MVTAFATVVTIWLQRHGDGIHKSGQNNGGSDGDSLGVSGRDGDSLGVSGRDGDSLGVSGKLFGKGTWKYSQWRWLVRQDTAEKGQKKGAGDCG